MSIFANNFWGDKHLGFETLSQNLKYGEQSCRDLEDFFKQLATVEDQYVKALSRIIKNVGSYNINSCFSPVWQIVKNSLDKLCVAHTDATKKWQDLAKEVHKYLESVSKKYKTLKESQIPTSETVQSMQNIAALLAKSKESYNAKFSDYKKVVSDRSTVKKIEKSETDFKKATEEYKGCVTKYNSTVDDFKKRLKDASDAFQENEMEFLTHLEQFMQKYATIREEKHTEIGELHYEFRKSLNDSTVEILLGTFITTKGTGTEPPDHVTFEEADLSSIPQLPSPLDEVISADIMSKNSLDNGPAAPSGPMIHLNVSIFRRKKKKGPGEKTADSKPEADKTSETSQPEVDEEGYIIRKDSVKKEDSSEETSDSDSDPDDKPNNKLKVEIKPLEGGGLSTTSSTVSLRLPTPTNNNKHQSDISNMSDLLDLFSKGPLSPRTTLQDSREPTPVSWNNISLSDGNPTAEDKEVFDTWNKSNHSNAMPFLPRPPSKTEVSSGRLSRTGRTSPMMVKQDSFSQQSVQNFSSAQATADTIPVAVALTENIMSRIRGVDHETQVGGNIIMSFPVDILSRKELPSLSFRVAGRSPDQIRVNSELLITDGNQHTFRESALLATLKTKLEENPTAKHFNVEVARYTLTVTCLPLNVSAHWKCEPEYTDVKLDYEYIGSALPKALPLTFIKFLVPVNGGVTSMQSLPVGVWSPEHQKVLWKLDELKSGSSSKGNMKARLQLSDGPSSPSSVDVQFLCDGTILSGTEFELTTKCYKVTFAKKRIIGKFLVDTDKLVTYV